MPAQLIALSEGPNILLDKPILLVGRDPECDIQIDSRKISRRHCCIAQVDDYLVIRDLGSTNGIRINGVRVLEGRLRGNDELTIGSSRFKVSWDEMYREPLALEAAPPPVIPTVKANLLEEELHRPNPNATADEDFVLESSDEPVPIAEPARVPIGTAKVESAKEPQTPAAPRKKREEPDWRRATAPMPPEEERKLGGIIPDELELAPLKEDDSKQMK